MSARIGRTVLREVADNQTWWKSTYHPGDIVPVSGIYRCAVCGREDA